MASPMELRSIQQGVVDSGIIDYYDIMVIGGTGMGKSTTSDKLVIANPDNIDYSGEGHSDESTEGMRISQSDLSMWRISDAEGELERVTRHLKDLVLCRSLESPREEVNNIYSLQYRQPTKKSQLISNETTKVRVLDVPGFFGERQVVPSRTGTIETTESAERVHTKGLAIMREVLRIQATMGMNLRRIVYFIPERGPLERAHQVLQIEMELMVYYFGKSIFDCMVLVATVNPDVYQYIPPDVVPFSNDAESKTRSKFQEMLSRVLPRGERLPDEKPPIIFLSMNDSCEDIYWKIRLAPVISDQVKLVFDHQTCSRCSIKMKFTRDNRTKVACYIGEDPSSSIAYEESLCHPLIVPKYWGITKITGGIVHFITGRKFLGKWPDFNNPNDEICIHCRQVPGTRGCLLVNSRYRPPGECGELVVDHQSDVTSHQECHP